MSPDKKEVLIFQHVENETAGTIKDFLEEKKIAYKYVRFFENVPLPDFSPGMRALVVMGGPMNVYEEDKFSFLKPETEFIRKAIEAGVPCLGVCLGSQLIAKAMGAKVYKAKAPEVGWDDIQLTPEAAKDPLFGTLGELNLKVLQWHEDTFDLPENAVHLARSVLVPNQAFRLGKNVYGFQFHVEVFQEMLQEWFKNRADLAQILEEHRAYQSKLGKISRQFYSRFFA